MKKILKEKVRNNTRSINLEEFLGNGTIFSGRPQGKMAREKLKVDQLDSISGEIKVLIPERTTSLNPSFMLGLFFQSYKKLKDTFSNKYKFTFLSGDENRQDILTKDIEDFYRQADLETSHDNRSIFDYFR